MITATQKKRKSSIGTKISFKTGQVEMIHGSGGRAMAQLIDQLFVANFDNEWLNEKNDQATLNLAHDRIVMTTDSHVVSPLFFPGGNIGSLAVHGTINDVAMAGAKPLYLSAGFILEEGFPLIQLKKIVESMALATKNADINIVAGDTKVVERGKGDGVFITTTGIGVIPDNVKITNQAKPGDKIIINGFIGDHGIAVMSKRENLAFDAPIVSDSCALHELVAQMVNAVPNIHCMRDPTRGGVAATLNEWAQQFHIGIKINENQIPIRTEVAGACELLGIDPLYVANEGKLIATCSPEDAELLLHTMQQHPLGENTAIIGEVTNDPNCFVQMHTVFGGNRIVDWLVGEQLPRIC